MGPKESDEEDAPIARGAGGPPADGAMPSGPSPEEEATLLMAQRGSEEFYGQAPLAENLAPVPAEESLPPLEDLVKRIISRPFCYGQARAKISAEILRCLVVN